MYVQHVTVLPNRSIVLHFQTNAVHWPPNATSEPSCSGSTTSDPPVPARGVPLKACTPGQSPTSDNCLCSTLTGHCQGGIHVASTASFPAGPWSVQAVNVTGPGWDPFNATVPDIGKSNPAAALLRDGRSLLVFRSHLKGGYWPGVEGEHIAFAFE